MADIPACLLMAIGQRDPDIIVKGILGEKTLPAPESHRSGVLIYPWQISTKYYTSTVNVCTVRDVSQLQTADELDVHAFVLYINEKVNTLSEIDSLLKSCNNGDLEVKILVCDQCGSDGESCGKLSKLQVQQWCIQNGFELVEINPAEVPDPEDDFPETLGIPRIVQALHAYPWPNLVMKDSSLPTPSASGASVKSEEVAAYERLGADGPDDETTTLEDVECFEQLFGQLSLFRNKASTLQGDQRRAYAEQMAVAFWKALGGQDEEEIDGELTSEDE